MFANLALGSALVLAVSSHISGVSNPLVAVPAPFLIRNGPVLMMSCAALLAAYLALVILRRKSSWLLSLPLATLVAGGGLMGLGLGTLLWYDASEERNQQAARDALALRTVDSFGKSTTQMIEDDLSKLAILQPLAQAHNQRTHTNFHAHTKGLFMPSARLTLVGCIEGLESKPTVCRSYGPCAGLLTDAALKRPEVRQAIEQVRARGERPSVAGPLKLNDRAEEVYLLWIPVSAGGPPNTAIVGACPVEQLIGPIVDAANGQPIAYEFRDARGQVFRKSSIPLAGQVIVGRYSLRGLTLDIGLAYLRPPAWPMTRVVRWVAGLLASVLTGVLLARVLAQTQRLREQNSWLGDLSQACIANVQDAFIVIDQAMRVVEWNPAAERLTGVPLRLAVGQTLDAVFPAAHRHGLLKYCRWALDHGKPIQRDDLAYSGDEIRGRYSIHGFPVHDTLVLQIRDLTSVREAQRRREQLNQLRSERAATLRLQQDKVKFVRALKHDILNMLNALSVSLYMFRRQQGERSDTVVLDQLEQIVLRIVDLTENLSEMVRLESGAVELSPAPCKVGELLGSLADQLRGLAERKGLRLDVLCENLDETEIIETDPSRLQRVLFNIVQNAIKFTAAGSVELIARLCAENPGQVEFEINDTGPGIANQELPKIFEPFYRGNVSKDIAGNGLGLTIVRQLIGVLGGRLSVRSVRGKGATFTVRIPWSVHRADAALGRDLETLELRNPA